MEIVEKTNTNSKNDIIRAKLFELPDESLVSMSKAAVYLIMHPSKFKELAANLELPNQKRGNATYYRMGVIRDASKRIEGVPL